MHKNPFPKMIVDEGNGRTLIPETEITRLKKGE